MKTYSHGLTRALVAVVFVSLVLTHGVASAGSHFETITLVSGAGNVGSADPGTQMSLDDGITFQPAQIVPPHSFYSLLPGTQWVSTSRSGHDRQDTTTLFRTTFTLPEHVTDASITVQVHADNAARIVLNGTQIGAQPDQDTFANFQNPAESYTGTSPLVVGVNTLDFVVRNSFGPMGLDYKAVVSYDAGVPPSLNLPADMTVNATSPAGATVVYNVTATDDADPSPDVVCTPPSGSTLAIGTTVVSCTATDDDGLSASGSFSVTVLDAGAQLADLLKAVDGVGPGKSLASKVSDAEAALQAGDVDAACDILRAFSNEVRAQSGKKLTDQQAADLIADATRIRAVLACG